MRPSKEKYYLDIASVVASRSTCNRRQYGAVLVKDDQIIATGYNGSARGTENCCDTGHCAREGLPHNCGYTSACPALHAESNAIDSAGRDAIGATLYLAGWDNGERIENPEPCEMCKRRIQNARIAQVISNESTTV